MGKFDGILLCTDLDDTLLTADKKVSRANSRAIEYFKAEGGLFTFATGRVPHGAKLMLEYVHPNAPMVCFNGGAIYDFKEDKILWGRPLDAKALKVVEYIDKLFDFVGIEICTEDNIYISKQNRLTDEHIIFEKLPENNLDYHDVSEKWMKVIFMAETDKLCQIRDAIAASPFADKYTFVQSSPWYYELLPFNSSKGEGLLQLADLLGIDHARTVAVGDNENDVMMIKTAGKGIAVANAIDDVKNEAAYITSADNENDAIAEVISALENGTVQLG
jgi:hypothetical protein